MLSEKSCVIGEAGILQVVPSFRIRSLVHYGFVQQGKLTNLQLSEPNALASGVASAFGPAVARSSGILLMPDASANGSLA